MALNTFIHRRELNELSPLDTMLLRGTYPVLAEALRNNQPVAHITAQLRAAGVPHAAAAYYAQLHSVSLPSPARGGRAGDGGGGGRGHHA